MKKIKIVGIIPAHLDSIRFHKKVIQHIYELPMIEHVRRRAKLSTHLKEIYVATNSNFIENLVKQNGGKVIKTKKVHRNGTSRCAEAATKIDCTHIVIIQGDEPLILPRQITEIAKNIIKKPNIEVWNAVGELKNKNELNKKTFVKCSLEKNNKISYFFRKTPAFSSFQLQKKYIKKVLGILAFKKEILVNYPQIKKSIVEEQEYIEQMSILTNNIDIYSCNISPCLPSVNLRKELNDVYKFIKSSKEQQRILEKIGAII